MDYNEKIYIGKKIVDLMNNKFIIPTNPHTVKVWGSRQQKIKNA